MKNNFIILIGSDGAGKSTIAKELSEMLGYPVEHHGPVKSYEEGKSEYFDCIKYTKYSVIKDRFHEGEAVYAPIYRGYKADYFPELEERIKEKFNPLLVLIEPPFSVIEERLKERGEDFVKPEHFRMCYNEIWKVFQDSTLPKILVNSHEYDAKQNSKQIVLSLFGLQLSNFRV